MRPFGKSTILYMFERFTEDARLVVVRSQEEARALKHNYIGTEHLLLGVLYTDSFAGAILRQSGLVLDEVRERVVNITGTGNSQASGHIPFTPRAKKVLEFALREALALGENDIDVEHVLLGILREAEGVGFSILSTFNVSLELVRSAVVQGREAGNEVSREPRERQQPERLDRPGKTKETLDRYTKNLTLAATQGKLDPVIGRDKEIRRMMQTLVRRTKNNPVLIGEPGVGKTAVVEGLAQLIASGNVPKQLRGVEILSVDMAGMVAGARYRGDFEERVKNMILESKQRKNVILFIDEIHILVGAGAAEGSVDGASILKPELARGELRTIGATTTDEYRKHFEKDAALERRFAPIVVEEPSIDDAVLILKGLRTLMSEHHDIIIDDSALEAAVKLGARYIAGRKLPDKAIDLIDEAAARVVVGKYSKECEQIVKELDEATTRYQEYSENDNPLASSVGLQIERLRAKLSEFNLEESTVTGETVADLIGEITGIPVNTISLSEGTKLMRLEESLRKRVIGQETALRVVAKAVRRARAGLRDPNRPAGSFIFAGPSGVGKTELAKALAEEMFGDEKSLIVLDMSEYAEQHSVSRLFGSPPGYVGHESGGQLTELVKRKPYSVLLLDEIEKAHIEVFNSLLQVLEEGRLTDGQGRVVDFSNVIIIMTSNLGAKEFGGGTSVGFSKNDGIADNSRIESKINEVIKDYFKPEFLNRLDHVVVFRSLLHEDMLTIVDMLLAKVNERMYAINLKVTVSDDAKAWLADRGCDKNLGARPLRRLISTEIEDPISELILEDRMLSGQEALVKVHADGSKLTATVVETDSSVLENL